MIRKNYLLFTLICISNGLFAQDILKYSIFDEGLSHGDSTRLINIFYFYSESSKKCKKIENGLFKNKKFIETVNANCNLIKINNSEKPIGSGMRMGTLKLFYGVISSPGFYVFWLRKDGRMMKLKTINGLKSEDQYLSILDKCITDHAKIPISEQLIDSPVYDEVKKTEIISTNADKAILDSLNIILNPPVTSLTEMRDIADKKNLLIYFSTKNCGPCKEFEKDFKNGYFSSGLKEFTLIKFDDSDQAGLDGIRAFKIRTFPTFITCRPKKPSSNKYIKNDWFGYSSNDAGRRWFLNKISF